MNIIQAKTGNILQITISREKNMNALNTEVLKEINKILNKTCHDESIRAVIFTGAGVKSFIAGADIAELESIQTPSNSLDFSRYGQRVFDAIENLPQVTIAAINGFALGGGLELALACDIRVAGRNAKLGLPEINLGLIPGFGGTQRMLRLLGYGLTKYLILTGKMIDAEKALQIGLVEEVCDMDELIPFVYRLAEDLSTKSPLVIERIKEIINHCYDYDLKKGLDFEASIFSNVCSSQDAKEGISSFLAKRKPIFTGK